MVIVVFSILVLVKEMLLRHPSLTHSVLQKLTEVFESLENEDVIFSCVMDSC